MSDFKLTYILRQHTPHIHFQHDQLGATLRATELKPKLDKLLLQKGNYKKDWFIGETKALDYKIAIRAESSDEGSHVEMIEEPKYLRESPGKMDLDRDGKPKVQSFPGYFGNLGVDLREKSNMKLFVLYDVISVNIFSYHRGLIEKIKEYFPEFIAKNNFGNRQSKGFGSYYLSDPEDIKWNPLSKFCKYHFKIDTSTVPLPSYIRFFQRSDEYKTYFKLFYALNMFYSSMRSGINFGGLYFKALMFMYAKEKNIQWDKKTIRDKFHLFTDSYREVQRTRTDPNGTFLYATKEKRMMRDILGLSSEQSWMSYKDIITKEHSKNEIDRFKSPLTFKIIREKQGGGQFSIFIFSEKIPSDYFMQKFKIMSKNNKSQGELEMQLPSATEFDLEDFLDFCFKRVFKNNDDFERHINRSSSPEARLLKQIYAELRNC